MMWLTGVVGRIIVAIDDGVIRNRGFKEFYVDRVKGKRRVKMNRFITLDTRLFGFEIN
jgi:hypothetical protein